jgi:hypothetical protein
MPSDFIQPLKTGSPEQKSCGAMDLARTGSKEAVGELIRVASGGNYTSEKWGKKYWYSFSRTCLSDEKWQYSLESQLIAIAALGESRSKTALDYLTTFGEWKLYDVLTDHCLGGYALTGKYRLSFPHATGPLRKELKDAEEIGFPTWVVEDDGARLISSRGELEAIGLDTYMKSANAHPQHTPFRNDYYLIIATAIKRLTATTKLEP